MDVAEPTNLVFTPKSENMSSGLKNIQIKFQFILTSSKHNNEEQRQKT